MKKLVLLFLIVGVTLAYADDSKLSPELRGKQSSQQVRVIVQYAPGTQVNCNGLLGLVDCLVNDIVKLGGTILAPLPLVNGVVALLDGPGILNLSKNANVVYISTDRPLTPTLSNAAPAVNAFAAWQSGYTGAGVGVALVDSGVSSHPDLNGGFLGASRVVWNQSFVPGNLSGNDQFGHGTHVAGLIAGRMSSHDASMFFEPSTNTLADGEGSFESPSQPMKTCVPLSATIGGVTRNVAVEFSSYHPAPDT